MVNGTGVERFSEKFCRIFVKFTLFYEVFHTEKDFFEYLKVLGLVLLLYNKKQDVDTGSEVRNKSRGSEQSESFSKIRVGH